MTLQRRYILALTARGFQIVEQASRKAVVLNKPGTGIYFWIGPSGSCRVNYTMKRKDGARPYAHAAKLLATPIVSTFHGA